RRLAGAVRPQQADDLAGPHLERDSVQRCRPTVAGAAVGLRQTVDAYHASNVLLEAAIAQGSVVFTTQVTDLVQQRPGDRLIQLGAVLHRPQQISTIKDDGPIARVALHGPALRWR